MDSSPGTDLQARLRAALKAAMQRRDRVATSALRTALAAIDNAEAIDATDDHVAGLGTETAFPAGASSEGRIAGASEGLGSTERPRRSLTHDDVVAILRAEVDQHLSHVADAERAGRPDQAVAARTRAQTLRSVLDHDT
jgi:uncharacterized protein YqeY